MGPQAGVRRALVFLTLLGAAAAQLGAQRAVAPRPAVPRSAAPSTAPAAAPANEWRQFRGTPNLTGVAASAPPATLKVLWTHELGETIESSAAIASGVVYVGSGDGDLVALDFTTGAVKWKYTTGNLIGESSPAVGAAA